MESDLVSKDDSKPWKLQSVFDERLLSSSGVLFDPRVVWWVL